MSKYTKHSFVRRLHVGAQGIVVGTTQNQNPVFLSGGYCIVGDVGEPLLPTGRGTVIVGIGTSALASVYYKRQARWPSTFMNVPS